MLSVLKSEPSVIVTGELNLSHLSVLPPLSWPCSWCQCLPAGFPLLPGVRAPTKHMQIYAQAKAGLGMFWWKRSMRTARSYAASHSLPLALSLSLAPFLSISPPSPAPSFLFSNSLTLICMQMCLSSIPLIVWLPAVSVCVCVPSRKKGVCVLFVFCSASLFPSSLHQRLWRAHGAARLWWAFPVRPKNDL